MTGGFVLKWVKPRTLLGPGLCAVSLVKSTIKASAASPVRIPPDGRRTVLSARYTGRTAVQQQGAGVQLLLQPQLQPQLQQHPLPPQLHPPQPQLQPQLPPQPPPLPPQLLLPQQHQTMISRMMIQQQLPPPKPLLHIDETS